MNEDAILEMLQEILDEQQCQREMLEAILGTVQSDKEDFEIYGIEETEC